MNLDYNPKSAYSAAVVVGALLALAGSIWLGVLAYQWLNPATEVAQSERGVPLLPVDQPTAEAEPTVAPLPTPTAAIAVTGPEATELLPPELPSAWAVTPRLLLDSDLGTGSSEFSAVALNEDLDRLLIADDEDRLFEFDLDDDGFPITPLRRTISVQVGAGDIEGLAWMFGSTYAIAHENDGQITVVEIVDDATTITEQNLVRTIDTFIREEDGNGLEGVAYIPGNGAIEFFVVDERPPAIFLIDSEGGVLMPPALDLSELDLVPPDVSDIAVSRGGVVSILSDEGRVILDMAPNPITFVVAGQVELTVRTGFFEQPEGLVRSRDGARLYVVGEGPGPDRFVFGFWSSN